MSATETRTERAAFLVFAGVIALAVAWLVLRPVLAPLVLAVLVVVVFRPLHRRIERRLGEGSAWSALTSLLVLTVVVGAPLVGLVKLLNTQVSSVLQEVLGEEENRSRLVELARQYLDWLSQLLQPVLGRTLDTGELLQAALGKVGGGLYERLPDLVGGAGRFALGALILYLVVFVLLLRGKALLDALVALLPMGEAHSHRIFERLKRTIRGVFLGAVVTALVQGGVGAVGFWLTGFRNFLIWGILIAAASFVPFVGTGLVWAPAALYLGLTGHLGAMLGMLAVGAVVSTVDNLVKPLLIHEQAEVHPVLVFLGLVGGFRSMGTMGLLYGPLLVACLTEAVRIYRSDFPPRRQPPAGPAVE